MSIFGYYINLDERGRFYADVRDEDGETVFEIKAGDLLEDDESDIFQDGFMKNKNDLPGLTEYMKDLGVVPPDARLLSANQFEHELELILHQGQCPDSEA